jgi:hypothetical protein
VPAKIEVPKPVVVVETPIESTMMNNTVAEAEQSIMAKLDVKASDLKQVTDTKALKQDISAMIQGEMDELRHEIREDMRALHVELVRQFEVQRQEFQGVLTEMARLLTDRR